MICPKKYLRGEAIEIVGLSLQIFILTKTIYIKRVAVLLGYHSCSGTNQMNSGGSIFANPAGERAEIFWSHTIPTILGQFSIRSGVGKHFSN